MKLNKVLNQMDKRTRASVVTIFIFLLALITLTVSYFTLRIRGNPTEDTLSVVAADLKMKFRDTNIVSVEGALPGYEATKTFTVKNEGNVAITYNPFFDSVINTFVDQTDLVYTIDCSTDDSSGTCYSNAVETQLPNTKTVLTRGILIKPQETHTYTMTIIFKDTLDNQDDNQGKRFNARIKVRGDEGMRLASLSAVGDTNSITATVTYIPPEFTNISRYYFKYEPVAVGTNNPNTNIIPSRMDNETNEITPTNMAAGEYTYKSANNTKYTGLTPGDYIVTCYVQDDRGRTSNEFSKTVRVVSTLAKRSGTYSALLLNAPSVLTSGTYATTSNYGKNIESLNFVTSNVVPNGVLGSWDVSSAQDGSIMAWYSDSDGDSLYEVVVGQVGGVNANPDSSYLFYNMIELSALDLTNLNTHNVFNMSYMFSNTGKNASSFIADFSNLDVTNTTNMASMFSNTGRSASVWSIGNLSGWDVSNVSNMSHMFDGAGYTGASWNIGNLNTWDTSNVTTMSYMFYLSGRTAGSYNLNLSNWDVRNVTTMSKMFYQAGYSAIPWSIGDLSSWDTSKVTKMNDLFQSAGYRANTFNLGDLTLWNTSSVDDMTNMFNQAGYSATTWNIGNLDNWNTANVTLMGSLFKSAGRNAGTFALGSLDNWETSKVTNMSYMFNQAGYSTTNFSIGDLSNWDISSVDDVSYMFSKAGYTSTSFDLGDLSNWNTSSLVNAESLFFDAGHSATTWNIGLLKNWNTANIENMSYMFSTAGHGASTFNLDLSNWNTESVTNMSQMFSYSGSNATSWSVGDISRWNTENVTNMAWMFNNIGTLANSEFSLEHWDTSQVIDMMGMFSGLSENTSLHINIKGFNLGSVDSELTSYEEILTGLPNETTITVGSTIARDWILSLSENYRNTLWTTTNIIVDNT